MLEVTQVVLRSPGECQAVSGRRVLGRRWQQWRGDSHPLSRGRHAGWLTPAHTCHVPPHTDTSLSPGQRGASEEPGTGPADSCCCWCWQAGPAVEGEEGEEERRVTVCLGLDQSAAGHGTGQTPDQVRPVISSDQQ